MKNRHGGKLQNHITTLITILKPTHTLFIFIRALNILSKFIKQSKINNQSRKRGAKREKMETIEVKIYKFSELSEEAKQKAIEKWRNTTIQDSDYWFLAEANETFKKFAELFNIDWKQIDYEESYRNDYSFRNIEDNVLCLSGHRLAKYIWNNYKTDLFKGKYFSLWSKKDVSFEHYKNGFPVLKSRYSKVILTNDCVLTGVCYDEDILKPIYDFLNNPTKNDFEDLLNDCISAICKSVHSGIKYQNSTEAIIETIEANDYDFLESGKMY
jgi:hypothetical protein